MLRIAVVSHPVMYHTLVNAVSRIHPDMSFSPALMTWNDVIDWLNREGADGIILERGIPFADRVLTMRFPTAVFAGDMNQFVQQYHVMVERLLLEVPKSLVAPQMGSTQDGNDGEKKKTIKIPFPVELSADPDVEAPKDDDRDQTNSLSDSNLHEDIQPEEENIQVEETEESEEQPAESDDTGVQKEHDDEVIERAMPQTQRPEGAKGTFAAIKGLSGFGVTKAYREQRQVNAVEYQAIPHRVVFYSPKGGAGVTSSVLFLANMSGAGVIEIAYPYGQMAGILGVNPEWTLHNTPDGREQSAVYRNQFLFSPWVYPIHERWDKETVRSWLQKGLRAFPDRMILVDLYAKAPLPILAEVCGWATRVVWILQDTDTDLGMADIQMRNLKKMMEVDPYKWSFVVQDVQGKTLPWEDILEIPLLAKLPERNRTSEWEKAWKREFHQLIAKGRLLRLLEQKEG